MEIKDIVDFMSEKVNRTEQEKAEMAKYFEEKVQTEEYSLMSDPVEALYLDVITAPFVYARDMGITGPFRSFEDYLHNGKVQEHTRGLNTDKNGFSMENMVIHTSDTGLTRVTYSATIDDTPLRLRNEYYFNGTLLAREVFHSIDGMEKNEVTVYDKNPLADTFLSYVHNTPAPEVAYIGKSPVIHHSDAIIAQPSNFDLAEDFSKSFTRPNLELERNDLYGTLENSLPTYRFDDGGEDFEVSPGWIYNIVKDYMNNHKDDEKFKDFKNVLPFLDYRPIIADVIKDLNNGGLLIHLETIYDSQGEFESQKEVENAIESYIYNTFLDYNFAYYTENILPAIKDELDAAYDENRAKRVELLNKGFAPLTVEYSLLERYDAINKGLYKFAHDAADSYSDGRDVEHYTPLSTLCQEVVTAFDDLEKRLFVSNLSKQEEEITMAMVLSGPNYLEIHPNDSLQNVVDDYKVFKEDVLPVLADSSKIDLDFKDCERHNILNTFVENKDKFKSALFKDAVNMFCSNVGDVLAENPDRRFITKAPLAMVNHGFKPLENLTKDFTPFSLEKLAFICKETGYAIGVITDNLKTMHNIHIKLQDNGNKEEGYNNMASLLLQANKGNGFESYISADLKTAYNSVLPALETAKRAYIKAIWKKEQNPVIQKENEYLAFKAYTDAMMKGKLCFKSEMFKKPCVAFCEAISRIMKNDKALDTVIRTGKLPSNSRSSGMSR